MGAGAIATDCPGEALGFNTIPTVAKRNAPPAASSSSLRAVTRVTTGDPCALTFLSSKHNYACKSVGAASPIDSPGQAPDHSVVRVESQRRQSQRKLQESELFNPRT